MKTQPRPSRAVPVEALADSFKVQLIETARRCLAMRRQFPGAVCRWRRAARTGPNSELALVFLWERGRPAEVQIWPYARIEELTAEITDDEARAEILRSGGTADADSTE